MEKNISNGLPHNVCVCLHTQEENTGEKAKNLQNRKCVIRSPEFKNSKRDSL
jgi:hypothetical protein